MVWFCIIVAVLFCHLLCLWAFCVTSAKADRDGERAFKDFMTSRYGSSHLP